MFSSNQNEVRCVSPDVCGMCVMLSPSCVQTPLVATTWLQDTSLPSTTPTTQDTRAARTNISRLGRL